MYYLDTFAVSTKIPPTGRHNHRKTLQRDSEMSRCLVKQDNKCFYCAMEIGMDGHLDHVVPIYWGGSNNRLNLVASCRTCNLVKADQQIEISNPSTINDYILLQKAYRIYTTKLQAYKDSNNTIAYRRLMRFQPKKVRLYGIYRADLFKSVR